jgi:hypothetical protein
MTLNANHVWKATPGCRILIIDSGAVRFDFPVDWIVHSGEKQTLLLDRCPPDESSYIGLRWRRISAKETALPVGFLVEHSSVAELRPIVQRGDVIRISRPPLEAAWIQLKVIDGKREMCSRLCVARGGCTQAIIVAEFAAADELVFFPVWETLLRTLAVGDYIADPSTGRKYEQRG